MHSYCSFLCLFVDSDFIGKKESIIIDYDGDEDGWEFVKIERYFGNGTKEILYKWRFCDGKIYNNKNLFSEQYDIQKNHGVITVVDKNDIVPYNPDNDENKKFIFCPDEVRLYVLYVFLLCVTFILNYFVAYWILLTILMLIKRYFIRKDMNLEKMDKIYEFDKYERGIKSPSSSKLSYVIASDDLICEDLNTMYSTAAAP